MRADVEVSIRRARADDAAALADLTTQLGYPVTAEEQAERLAAVLADPDHHAVLVAVDATDRPIGWAHVERARLLELTASAHLGGLVVDEAHRSAGIGRRLLREAEAVAVGWECDTLRLRSRTSRERAHRFYRREGYELVKTSYVFERRLDRLRSAGESGEA